VFRRRNFLQGQSLEGAGIKDIHWIKPDGTEMSEQEWQQDFARSLGVYLSGESLGEVDRLGRPVQDENFILLFNAHHERIDFRLPGFMTNAAWQSIVDTHYHSGLDPDGTYSSGDAYPLEGRTFVLLRECASAITDD
jgi:glycogen operon protein